MKGSVNEAAIMAVIRKGPITNRELSKVTGLNLCTTGSILGRLLGRKQIVYIGTAQDAGITDVRGLARVYAMPGTTPLARPQLEPEPEVVKRHTPHNGMTERIRQELIKGGPGTCAQFERRLGLGSPAGQLAPYLRQMEVRTQEVIAEGSPKVYELCKPKEQRLVRGKSEGSGTIAGRITIGRGTRWGAGLA